MQKKKAYFIHCSDKQQYKVPIVYKHIKIRGYEFIVHNAFTFYTGFIKGVFAVTYTGNGLCVGRDNNFSVREAIRYARKKILAYSQAEFDKIIQRSYSFIQ